MKFKIFSDNAKSFTFKHEFETMDHAKLATTCYSRLHDWNIRATDCRDNTRQK